MAAIDALDGMGPSNARTLRRAGIRTTDALIRKAATSEDRRALAAGLSLGEREILAWVLNIDLMRIKGIGVLYCRLLNQVGVFTIEELRAWNPHTLLAMIIQVNERLGLSTRLPNLERVTAWIREAQVTESVVQR